MSVLEVSQTEPKKLPILGFELTNICNLHCSYCVRDDDALHHDAAKFFPMDLLRRILREANSFSPLASVSFTGGEPTLHPNFSEVLDAVAAEGLKFSFVTNGWHFERIYPAVLKNSASVGVIAFSLDGATRQAHDRWRGKGSFDRVIRAITRCHAHRIPFEFKVGIRRDTVPQLEQVALLAARLGAGSLRFWHLLPTSSPVEAELALDMKEREKAEQEIATLAQIFRMNIGIGVGYYNLDPSAPCHTLLGQVYNVDYLGRLTLCCNLSGFRGGAEEADVVADLSQEGFSSAYARFFNLTKIQNDRRKQALSKYAERNEQPDLYTGSPCLFCLQCFGKIPWRPNSDRANSRSLPVMAL